MTALKPANNASNAIEEALTLFVDSETIRHVYFLENAVAPPQLAYVTSFPRLALPLQGHYPVEAVHDGSVSEITCKTGEAIFVAKHCWEKPQWTAPVSVLTLLFGKRQIGFSLVEHDGASNVPMGAIKASIPAFRDELTQSILNALLSLQDLDAKQEMGRLLIGVLLHACLHLLRKPLAAQVRRANHTYDTMCLFVQEHYQQPLTREHIARHFGLHPCHVSRLFRNEGHMRFTDYVTLVRIERAKFLLKNYDIPIKQVAANCGFSDTAYFCKMFKTMARITPSMYRMQSSPLL